MENGFSPLLFISATLMKLSELTNTFKSQRKCMVSSVTLPNDSKNVHAFLSSAEFFQIQHFRKIFQEYHLSVKQIGSRSGPTFCRA